jgi:Leu/Phe-tRNA-protein transferase
MLFRIVKNINVGQNGTWITNDMIEAYVKLNQMGLLHRWCLAKRR